MSQRSEVERSFDTLTGRVTFGLCFLVAFCIAVTALLVWFGISQSHQAASIRDNALETHAALCAFKSDLERRHSEGVKYLREHPQGLVSERTGEVLITAAQFNQSLNNQKDTLDALAALDCTLEG